MNIRLIGIISLCATQIALGAGGGGESNQPAIQVPAVNTPPVLDAKLDDPCWSNAVRLTGFHVLGTNLPANVQTIAWLCRDDTWLYLAFRCLDPQAAAIIRSAARRDGVFTDDAVEIFIDPGTDGKQWAHLTLSANNVQRDQWCEGATRAANWDLPWRSAALVDPHVDTAKGWSAEIAIPLINILKWGPGNWRFNLCRNRRTANPVELTTLAVLPAGSGFHAPAYFLSATGLTGFAARPVFGPLLGEVAARPVRAGDGKRFYDVNIGLRNIGGLTGSVEIVVQDVPSSGKGTQATQTVELAPKAATNATVAVEIAGLGARAAWVALRDPATGFVFERADVPDMAALAPFEVYLDRNYYTTEDTAGIRVEMHVPRAERSASGLRLTARVIGVGGKPIAAAEADCAADEFAVRLPLSDVPVGEHRLLVSVAGKDGELGLTELKLCKRLPAPAGANEVKIDRYNRCLLVNGQPFFPIGAFGFGFKPTVGMDPAKDWKLGVIEAQYGYCREAGFNFLCDWSGYAGTTNSLAACRADYDLAHKFGLKIIGRPWAHDKDLVYGGPKFREAAARIIAAMDPYLEMCRSHPATLAYYHFDEPGGTPGITDVLENYYQKIRSVDPYHPVYMSLYQIFLSADQKSWFDTVADLIGAHCYWYVGRPDNLRTRSMRWHKVDLYAREAHIPTMTAPQHDHWGTGYTGGGFMLPDEQRAQTYLALVHGSRSLMHFAMPWHHQLSVDTQKQISAEVRALAPALLTREPKQEVTFEPDSACAVFSLRDACMPGTGEWRFPLVETSLRIYPTGEQVLLAVNPGSRALTARFTVSSLTADSTVERMFVKKERAAVSNASFTDTLAPFDTRAWRLTAAKLPADGPVRIHLAMSGPAVEAAAQPAVPTPKPPRKNLVVNPSFERARMAGHPDSWHPNTLKYLIPDPRACGLETNNPFHGKYCFRIVREFPNDTFAYGDPATVKRDTTYTLSAYLRADKPGTEVRMRLFGEWKPVKLGTTWERYSMSVSSGQATMALITIYLWQDGVFYADAVQLEEGTTATEFEPD